MTPIRPIVGRKSLVHQHGLLVSAGQPVQQPQPQNRSWLLSKTQQQTRQLRERPWRKVQKARPDIPLYELPYHVLDLNDEYSAGEYVKPYDEAIEADQIKHWQGAHASIYALEERIDNFKRELFWAEIRRKATREKATLWKADDRDIWAAALLGTARRVGAEELETATLGDRQLKESVEVHKKLLYRHGILKRVAAKPYLTLDVLLMNTVQQSSNKTVDPDSEAGSTATAQAIVSSPAQLHRALATCHNFGEVRRLLSRLTRNRPGCMFFAAGEWEILEQLSAMVPGLGNEFVTMKKETESQRQALGNTQNKLREKEQKIRQERDAVPAEDMLALLLNIQQALASFNIPLSRVFSAFGMRLAAQAQEPAALQRFLQQFLLDKSINRPRWFRPTGDVVLAILNDIRVALIEPSAPESPLATRPRRSWPRAELFSVLTGQHLLQSSSLTDTSMLDLIDTVKTTQDQAFKLHDALASILAELGAVRTLWEVRSSGTLVVMPKTLVTSVVRYAAYMEVTNANRQTNKNNRGQATATKREPEKPQKGEKTGKTQVEKITNGQDAQVLDLKMIHSYEQEALAAIAAETAAAATAALSEAREELAARREAAAAAAEDTAGEEEVDEAEQQREQELVDLIVEEWTADEAPADNRSRWKTQEEWRQEEESNEQQEAEEEQEQDWEERGAEIVSSVPIPTVLPLLRPTTPSLREYPTASMMSHRFQKEITRVFNKPTMDEAMQAIDELVKRYSRDGKLSDEAYMKDSNKAGRL